MYEVVLHIGVPKVPGFSVYKYVPGGMVVKFCALCIRHFIILLFVHRSTNLTARCARVDLSAFPSYSVPRVRLRFRTFGLTPAAPTLSTATNLVR